MAIDLTLKPRITKEKIKEVSITLTREATILRVITEVLDADGDVLQERYYSHEGGLTFLSAVINRPLLIDKIYDYLLTRINGTKVAD